MSVVGARLIAILASTLLFASTASATTSTSTSTTTTTTKKSTHKSTTSTAQAHTTKTHAKAASKTGSTAHTKSASTHSSKSKHGKKTTKSSWKSKGQHGIDSDRTRQIQEALIKQNYLSGEADGSWDSRTQEAMRRYQEDHGWQSKVLPDSRALIKLGLGPDHKEVLNPETAAVSPYANSGAATTAPASATASTAVIRDQQ